MPNLQKWESLIKEKRKKTEFRAFLKEIASWCPIMLYNNGGKISRYNKKINRINFVDNDFYSKNYESINDKNQAEYNFGINFFDNFSKIWNNYQFPQTYQISLNENCDFSDVVHMSKNIYLSFFTTTGAENVLYSYSIKQNSRNIFNSISIGKSSENIYMSSFCLQSYNTFYSYNIHNSSNIWFSSNLIGCSECIFCDNLENQSYFIENKKYSKEDYFEKKMKILKEKENFKNFHKKAYESQCINFLSKDSSGFCIYNSNFVNSSIFCGNLNNGNNSVLVFSENGVNNSYDSFLGGSGNSQNLIGQMGSGLCENIYLSILSGAGSNNYYSQYLDGCSFCIGCIGLRNKSFCILNKQYSKEEWLELADKIFSQMDKDGVLGDFFPGSLNPFYFNDTMAYLIDDSFTKEEVEKENYLWRNKNIKVDIPENAEIIYTSKKALNQELERQSNALSVLEYFQNFDSNGNWQINPEILKKVIQDENGNIYKIVKMEYDFLVKYGLPLPEIHWLDRIKLGFKF